MNAVDPASAAVSDELPEVAAAKSILTALNLILGENGQKRERCLWPTGFQLDSATFKFLRTEPIRVVGRQRLQA